MKKKKQINPFTEFYKQSCRSGRMRYNLKNAVNQEYVQEYYSDGSKYLISGMCDLFYNQSIIPFEARHIFDDFLHPTPDDMKELRKEGKSNSVWASDLTWEQDPQSVKSYYIFNPLRQNLILLGELLYEEKLQEDVS